MVVDAAIVVLENIFRLKEKGEQVKIASFKDTVRSMASSNGFSINNSFSFCTNSSNGVRNGQLLSRYCCSNICSGVNEFVSINNNITSSYKLDFIKKSNKKFKISILDNIGKFVSEKILAYVSFILKSKKYSLALVGFLMFTTIGISYLLLPKLEYLPEGNRNLIFGVMLPLPGYNLDTLTEIAESVEDKVKPLWASEKECFLRKSQPPKNLKLFLCSDSGR